MKKSENETFLEQIVLNKNCSNATLAKICESCSEHIAFMICNNQERLLKCPNLIYILKKNSKIIILKGKTRALLTGERTALNFLGYLSGIATNTANYVKEIKPFKAKILDTRKTTPTLRELDKYAVRCGGGHNHRGRLDEMALIKDNHVILNTKCVSIENMVNMTKFKTKKKIEVEVRFALLTG